MKKGGLQAAFFVQSLSGRADFRPGGKRIFREGGLSVCQRQREAEAGSPVGVALGENRAAVGFDDGAAEVQSESCP
jgi:hypothetical protein